MTRRVAGGGGCREREPPPSAWRVDEQAALRWAWAARLTWPDAIVGLRVAGAIHGFPVAVADEVEMYCLAARVPSRGLRVRRARVPLDDIEMFGGLLLTTAQRTAVDLLGFTRGGAVSAGERLAHDLLTASGIGGRRAGAEIWDGGSRVAVVDLLFERARLVVEIDGFRAHSGRESFERDRRRQNQLIRLGYRVLRFTWRDLTDHPDSVVAQIRSML